MNSLAICLFLLALGPAVLFLRNVRAFRVPPLSSRFADDVSILIPARNEERNIRAAVEAALANRGAEVLVLNDHSRDATAGIVREIAAREPRLRLLEGDPLPAGWFGKNWACAQLAAAARRPVLLFADADVRLGEKAAATCADWLRRSSSDLGSGMPLQEVGSFSERLLIPLIHFVMLGFLPLRRMRASRHPAYATGCGQLFVIDAAAYRACRGHGAIRDRIHDGLALPRSFREQGRMTDLFDATPLATCRMYRNGPETWQGFLKNTYEGLGQPKLILPATLVILGGQVAPFLLLPVVFSLGGIARWSILAAALCALLPRFVAAFRFRQPLRFVWLHPIALAALLALQWIGLVRFLRGQPTAWKGRRFHSVTEKTGSVRPVTADLGRANS